MTEDRPASGQDAAEQPGRARPAGYHAAKDGRGSSARIIGLWSGSLPLLLIVAGGACNASGSLAEPAGQPPSSVVSVPAATTGSAATSATARPDAVCDSLPQCVEQLVTSDEGARRHAEQELRKLGRQGWKALRQAARHHPREDVRAAASKLWGKLMDEQAAQLLASRQVARPGRTTEPKWELAASSDLVPYVRIYKFWDRYPHSVVLDLLDERELPKVDESGLQQLFQRSSPAPLSRETAGQYVAFFLRLSNEPYGPSNIHTSVEQRDDGLAVTAIYRRTTVWSPPNAPYIAGSRVAEIRTRWQVSPQGELRLVDSAERTLSTSP